MHQETAKERLRELVERVSGEDYALEDLEKEGKNKRGAHVLTLLGVAHALLLGDEQDLAYRFVRAAVGAMGELELELGDGE